ncbi:replication fork protection component Swi3-domain-containing protein [Collybia nuda]|uniref:Chromosome segregation in meiosis protein n=1 Tax=Collybia nuda TaxID=64659 RepID=A0A9P5Y8Q1_9AGAR|nr:replication fork protection component Swi3-domain-containing protein [Collybia nuda]
MNSLDSIWDEPVVNEDPPLTPKESLFLESSEDEPDKMGSHGRQRHTQVGDIDIDALFAGIDDDGDDDAFTIKPLAPSLDTEVLRREAESRHKNRLLSLTPHAILPSSSPPRDTENGADMRSKGDDREKDTTKSRRKPVRLDEGRLLGPTGFPQLIKDTKDFRTKGKGHEVADLNRLLQVYQFWTHGLYPKTQFRDTVERIEKLCHSKRMNVSLSVWKDNARGRMNNDGDSEDDEVIDLTKREDTSNGSKDHFSPRSDRGYTSPPSRTELDDEDFDLEAIFHTEDERRAKDKITEGDRIGGINEGGVICEKEEGTASMADDDSMWDELDALESVLNPTSHTSSNTEMDDDQTIWDELDQIQGTDGPNLIAPDALLVSQNTRDDHEMWDVNAPQSTSPAVVATSFVSASSIPPRDDYDIEDMYV